MRIALDLCLVGFSYAFSKGSCSALFRVLKQWLHLDYGGLVFVAHYAAVWYRSYCGSSLQSNGAAASSGRLTLTPWLCKSSSVHLHWCLVCPTKSDYLPGKCIEFVLGAW